jgi:hypothetical protein
LCGAAYWPARAQSRCGGVIRISADIGFSPDMHNQTAREDLTVQLSNDSPRYDTVSQAFHWITVGLVIVLLLTGKVGDI